jgi:hypothetical protein
MYLNEHDKREDALQQLRVATELAGENGFSHYNIGLAYFDLGMPELALAQAHKARALGFPSTELADKLRAKGQWKDPDG